MDKLGKMIRITDLRSVWPHEANDFTKWLAQKENLTLLGAIDIELELEERESAVGRFNVDIQAIEWLNQHTDSNIRFKKPKIGF